MTYEHQRSFGSAIKKLENRVDTSNSLPDTPQARRTSVIATTTALGGGFEEQIKTSTTTESTYTQQCQNLLSSEFIDYCE